MTLKSKPNLFSIFSGKQTETAFFRRQKMFKKENGEKIFDQEEKLFKIISKSPRFKKYFEDYKDLFFLLKDYYVGNYKNVPLLTIASIGGTFYYTLFPVVIIPSPAPSLFMGYVVDDAAVFQFCLKFVKEDLEKYREWKDS